VSSIADTFGNSSEQLGFSGELKILLELSVTDIAAVSAAPLV
jgi:hypothetical protein